MLVEEIDLAVSDEELVRISRERLLALSLAEMKVLQAYFAREDVRARRQQVGLGARATDVELEALAQTWSEHCKHKIFNAVIDYTDERGRQTVIDSLFDTYIKGATRSVRTELGERDWCVSVFNDNAGVISWDDHYNLVFKVETHNSPSALDPYGGALTGIVGREPRPAGHGQGARASFSTPMCSALPLRFMKRSCRRASCIRGAFLKACGKGLSTAAIKAGSRPSTAALSLMTGFWASPWSTAARAASCPVTILGEPSQTKAGAAG